MTRVGCAESRTPNTGSHQSVLIYFTSFYFFHFFGPGEAPSCFPFALQGPVDIVNQVWFSLRALQINKKSHVV